jgi:urease accessory protein
MTNPWHIWQLVDSAFPTGGFAHSGGLEAALQHGLIADADALREYIQTCLVQSRRGLLYFVLQAHQLADAFADVDRRCDLFLNNHVANRASRAQGRALLASAGKTFEQAPILELMAQVREQKSPGHLAPSFGRVAQYLCISAAETADMYQFMTARGILSAAVRLGAIGPIQAQQMQTAIALEQRLTGPTSDQTPVQTAPLLDLIQATHERLYSKLFQS